MTIHKALSLATLATGVTLASVGFTDYAALKGDGSYQATAPNWRKGSAYDGLDNDASGVDLALRPRALIYAGGAIDRTLVQLHHPVTWPNTPPNTATNEYAVILAVDDKNFMAVGRGGYAGTMYLQFYLVTGGVLQTFPWQILYADSTPNFYAVLPETITLETVVNGSTIEIWVDGKKQYLHNTSTGITTNESIPRPSALSGATGAGFWQGGNSAHFATLLQLRDNADRVAINAYSTVRANPTQSRLRIGGTCNVAGASNVQVTVHDLAGNLVGSGAASIVSGQWAVDVGPIPLDKEGAPLRVEASNIGGTVDTFSILFDMPTTLVQTDFRMGQNESSPAYFAGAYPYNDLARTGAWRTASKYARSYWMDAAPSLYPTNVAWEPASALGLQPNGSPTAFPTSSTVIGFQLPWWPGAGTYELDMRQAPDANWSLSNTAGLVTVTPDFYGLHWHKVVIAADYIPPFTTGASWAFNITPDATKPNLGLPTTSWLFTFKRVGTTDAMVWSQRYIDYLMASGVTHIRYMTSQCVNRSPALLPGALTAANRLKPTDQCWITWPGVSFQISHPIEHIVQLHNFIRKDIWLCITDVADESYVRFIADYLAANLDPTIKVYIEVSNERWNSSFAAYVSYINKGLTDGLGFKVSAGCLTDAVFGTTTGPHTIPPAWVATTSYTTGDERQSDSHIYAAKTNITGSSGNLKPGNDLTRWQKVQDGLVAQRRAHINDTLLKLSYIADEFGGSYASRVLPVFSLWDRGFDGELDDYMTWGDNWTKFKHLAVGAYYGGTDLIYANMTAAQKAMIASTSGNARIEVLKAIARPAMIAEVARYADHARVLRDKLVALGGNELDVEMSVYEGGQSWALNLKDAGGDQTVLLADMLNFRASGIYDLEYDFWKGLRDAVGGVATKFEFVTPVVPNYPTMPSNGQILYWGVSKDIGDRADTSAGYTAIRDIATAFGGGVVEALPYPIGEAPTPAGGFDRYPVSFFLE